MTKAGSPLPTLTPLAVTPMAKNSDEQQEQQQGGDRDDAVQAAKSGNEAVQKLTDKETEQGYTGTVPDPTPNENYTVAGVTSGAPTPETDEGAAEAARQRHNEIARAASGLA